MALFSNDQADVIEDKAGQKQTYDDPSFSFAVGPEVHFLLKRSFLL